MPAFPKNFLVQLAQKYGLSQKQEEAFVALYSRSDDNERATADELHISLSAFKSRMTGVYGKFSISGDGPGKYRALQVWLMQQKQSRQPMPEDGASEDIDVLVREVRELIRPIVKEKCGSMKVLDMEQPIELTGERGIYTKVNILEKISGRQRRNLQEMLAQAAAENFDRFGLGQTVEKTVPGLEAVKRHRKLLVLGKPGAGKTTFLKWLAMQCISGNEWSDRVPIFVTLKQFAETPDKPTLIEFIQQNLGTVPQGTARKLLKAGKGLVLLDGLDEVREEDTNRILQEIEFLSNNHLKNQYILTCRVAAKEYIFQQFTEVEVADFDDEQIQIFISNWFIAKEDLGCADLMWDQLAKNPPIKELASSPLLLTLLCLMFEDTTDFPANRSELYQEGVDVLLKKWDGKRKIQRDEIYKKLSLKRKEDLLSQIALITFENKDYFVKQRRLEELIEEYIINLPDTKDDPEVLRLDREAVLKSIEAQHGLLVERARGIYSFSHLTFQEFFSARQIVETRNFELLRGHFLENRWREVILLSLEMLHNADEPILMLKAEIDALVSHDEKIQDFLAWTESKIDQVRSPYKPATIRAFYSSLELDHARDFARARALTFVRALEPEHDLDPDLDVDLILDRALELALMLNRIFDLDLHHHYAGILAMNLSRALDFNLADLHNHIQRQKKVLRDAINLGQKELKKWWDTNGNAWTQELRQAIINHRNTGYDWQFSRDQIQLRNQYYEGNRFLVTCLKSGCYLSKSVRQKIEDEILLPMAEIERRNSEA